MCAYMYKYMYVYVHAYIYVYTLYLYIYVYICMNVCIYYVCTLRLQNNVMTKLGLQWAFKLCNSFVSVLLYVYLFIYLFVSCLCALFLNGAYTKVYYKCCRFD